MKQPEEERLSGLFFELSRIAFNRKDLDYSKLKKFSEMNILIVLIELILILILFILVNINAGDCSGREFRKFENVYLSFYLVYVVVNIISFTIPMTKIMLVKLFTALHIAFSFIVACFSLWLFIHFFVVAGPGNLNDCKPLLAGSIIALVGQTLFIILSIKYFMKITKALIRFCRTDNIYGGNFSNLNQKNSPNLYKNNELLNSDEKNKNQSHKNGKNGKEGEVNDIIHPLDTEELGENPKISNLNLDARKLPEDTKEINKNKSEEDRSKEEKIVIQRNSIENPQIQNMNKAEEKKSGNSAIVSTICGFCDEQIKGGDKVAILPCNHYYHIECEYTMEKKSCTQCFKEYKVDSIQIGIYKG